MKYLAQIMDYHAHPDKLEELYRQAEQARRSAEFAEDLEAAYQASPGNLLFSAWHYRLLDPIKSGRSINWALAVPLALVCGLIFFLVSGPETELPNHLPLFILVWAPVVAAAAIAFLTFSSKNYTYPLSRPVTLGLGAGVLALAAYAVLMNEIIPSQLQDHFIPLMILHLPLAALAAVGIFVTGWRGSPTERFSFLIKALEAATTGGLMAIGLGIFTGVTAGLFDALGINLSEAVMRLIIAGIGGSVPLLAIALVYDPAQAADAQDFQHGFSRFISNIVRLLVAPTLVVAVIYVLFIPFNFMEPFKNRDVLIAYNVMLFAVMGLLLGATPLRPDELPQAVQRWLRLGILAIAGLALLVSLYALSATLYRTLESALTMNRMTILGWNLINIAILGLLLYRQLALRRETWVASLQTAFSYGAVAYTVWAVFLIISVPLLFR